MIGTGGFMNWARVFFGSLLAIAGAVLLLDYTGALDAGDVFATWWPLVVIAAGVLSYFSNPRNWQIPLIIVIVGAALLLRSTGVVETLEVVVPALLILVGIFVIAGRSMGSKSQEAGDRITGFTVFSGSQIASHSKQFQGGSLGALFGGVEVDLRDAHPAPGANLDVFAAFGGIEIRVPQGWQVTTKGLPIFGGFDNATTKDSLPPDSPHLDINATVLFGGLDVRH
jgi:Domain of unknown function (DUF5668)